MTTIAELTYNSFSSKPSSKLLPLGLGLGSVTKVSELSSVRATQSAIEFYTRQTKEKITFDTHEKENNEFCNQVGRLTNNFPYRFNDTLKILWKEKIENSRFEFDCNHGVNCVKFNKCNCTPLKSCLSVELKIKDNKEENTRSEPTKESPFDNIWIYARSFFQ